MLDETVVPGVQSAASIRRDPAYGCPLLRPETERVAPEVIGSLRLDVNKLERRIPFFNLCGNSEAFRATAEQSKFEFRHSSE